MDVNIHTYKELYYLTVHIDGEGRCRRDDPMKYHIRDVINKMACYSTESCYDLVSVLYHQTESGSIPHGGKLFVSSCCKTGRDTFRNSGYSITRSPDNADAIVIPDVRGSFYLKLGCNFVAKDEKNDELFLVTVDKPAYGKAELDDREIDAVRLYLKTALALEVDEVDNTDIKVVFIPKCDEIVDVLKNNTLNKPYIQESKVQIHPSTTISPETLLFWENIDDPNLLVRTICTSDWNKYPMTILALLYGKPNGSSNWFNHANGDFRRILNAIGYKSYSSFQYAANDKFISPEDFKMLQGYMYLKLGIDGNGGFVGTKTYNSVVPSGVDALLQKKVVLKPLEIPTSMKLSDIKAIVER